MAGSGGGASGAISFPAYIVAAHGSLLDQGGTVGPELSIIGAMNAAIGASPFLGATAYDPSSDIGVMDGRITAALASLAAYSVTGNYTAARAAASVIPLGTSSIDDSFLDSSNLNTSTLDTITLSEEEIAESMVSLDAILTEQLEFIMLPRYKAGMLNINAIQTSSFVIGEAIMRGMKGRDVAKHGSDLRIAVNGQVREINARHQLSYRELNARHAMSHQELNAQHARSFREITARHLLSFREINARLFLHQQEGINSAAALLMQEFAKRMAFEFDLSRLFIEEIRIRVVMEKEAVEEQLSIDESDMRWDLETFRYVGNFLAAPSGGVAQATDRKNRVASGLGGALSGAAAGAMVGTAAGGPYGTVIGAGVGALIGGLGGGLG